MACRLAWRLAVGLLVGSGTASPSAGQVRVLVTSVGYQSPGLVAPVVTLSSFAASGGRAWTIGLVGSTLAAEWTRIPNPTVSTVVGTEVTLFGSNSSTRVYRDGRRDHSLEFRDRTLRLKAGLRFLNGSPWRLDVRAIALDETVAGPLDSTVLARWKAPYLGMSIEASYRHVVADDPLEDRWDGVKVAARAEGFVGRRPWWRSQLSMGAGHEVGRVTLRGRAWVLLGHNLDIVNRHLVGGCWDLAGSPSLYGYDYAAFRVDRAVVFGGGADVRLAREWKLGVRLGYLRSASRSAYGEAVSLSTMWDGIGIHAGIGLPGASLFHRETHAPLIFGSVTAVVF